MPFLCRVRGDERIAPLSCLHVSCSVRGQGRFEQACLSITNEACCSSWKTQLQHYWLFNLRVASPAVPSSSSGLCNLLPSYPPKTQRSQNAFSWTGHWPTTTPCTHSQPTLRCFSALNGVERGNTRLAPVIAPVGGSCRWPMWLHAQCGLEEYTAATHVQSLPGRPHSCRTVAGQ